MTGRIVIAFSGGEGGSAALAALARTSADVVAVIVDAGRERGLESVRQQALALGAVRVHVIDARDEFLQHCVLPALQIGSLADPVAAANPALLHPVVARVVADIASMEDAVAVAHGAEAGSPLAERLGGLIAGAGFCGPIQAAGHARPPTGDAYIGGWARRVCGRGKPPEPGDRAAFLLTRAPAAAPGRASLEISFLEGRPTAVNGVTLSLGELVEVLSTIAGDHGVGRVLSVDAADDGWTVTEAPAAIVLSAAFTSLCDAAGGSDALAARAGMTAAYRAMLDEGRWYAPVRAAIQAFAASLASRVSGTAHLDLGPGDCRIVRAELAAAVMDGVSAAAH